MMPVDMPGDRDVLFAPWRYDYLVSDKSASACIFCEAAAVADDRNSLVVYRGKRVFVILNRYPYTNGHVMVAPFDHVGSLSGSDEETLRELITTVARAEKILSETYRTDGLNIGLNLGAAAGAGIANHYHVHVVPRWKGDTNFMSVAAGVRVVPEELSSTRVRLAPLFAETGS
jgi:ATP adenylyltransferase